MPTLYLTQPGSRLEKEYQRLLVTLEDDVLLEVALENVSDVVLVGTVGVTTPALHSLLNKGIPLILVARSGALLGRLSPAQGGNLPLRQAQHRMNDDPRFCLEMARAIVKGKLRNQRVLLQRIDRREVEISAEASRAELDRLILQAGGADSIEILMGIEGRAAKIYLEVFRQALNPEWRFEKRVRRPPRDPANALLSLGYTFLSHAASSALEVAGLDPYLGYFHSEKYNRPTLALDLIEEFRSPIVDSLVLNILNHDMYRPEDFEVDPETGGVRLDWEGFRFFLAQFSTKLESFVYVRQVGRSLTYRKLLEVQARRIAQVILGKKPSYEPYQAR